MLSKTAERCKEKVHLPRSGASMQPTAQAVGRQARKTVKPRRAKESLRKSSKGELSLSKFYS
jgi:hypothetical protein